MPYDFTLTAVIPASAPQIYDAWLSSLAHSEMTGSTATMTNKIGANVSAWGGYITGRNLELVPGERIVQSWRTSQFTDENEDSIITITLERVSGGTLLTLVHANVPDGQTSYERGGWQDHYFKPMMDYFARTGAGRPKKAKTGASKSKRKPTTAKTKTRKAPTPKAAATKKTPKRVGSAKVKAKSAKLKNAKPKTAKRTKSKAKRRTR